MAAPEEKPNPAAPRKLSSEQKAKAAEWIKQHAKQGCPICKSTSWNLADDFVEIRPLYTQTVIGGGHVYPGILFVCNTCGHVMIFNAIVTGVLPKENA